MSCNLPMYVIEQNIIMSTIGRQIISKKWGDNIDIWFYTSSMNGKNYVNNDKHIIYTDSADDKFGTLDKTLKALTIICDLYKDEDFYVIRTNCSTLINIPYTINFIENTKPRFFGGKNVIIKTDSNDYENEIITGEYMILSKNTVLDILSNDWTTFCKRLSEDIQDYAYTDDTPISMWLIEKMNINPSNLCFYHSYNHASMLKINKYKFESLYEINAYDSFIKGKPFIRIANYSDPTSIYHMHQIAKRAIEIW